jgi:hypothetical protein
MHSTRLDDGMVQLQRRMVFGKMLVVVGEVIVVGTFAPVVVVDVMWLELGLPELSLTWLAGSTVSHI